MTNRNPIAEYMGRLELGFSQPQCRAMATILCDTLYNLLPDVLDPIFKKLWLKGGGGVLPLSLTP